VAKNWYQSKTVWFNVVAAVVLVVKTVWPEFADFELDPMYATGLVALVNLALRFVTREPVEF